MYCHNDGKKVYQLLKSIYGLKQSPLNWNLTINQTLLDAGFVRNNAESCLYHKVADDGKPLLIGLYVDDLLIAGGSEAEIIKVKKLLSSKFKMTDMGISQRFLGIEFKQDEDKIEVSLNDYIQNIVNEFGFEDIPSISTPMVPGLEINDTELCDGFKYRSLVGKLMFASVTVRGDITYSVSVLSRYLKEPTVKAWKAAVRVLRYLKGTSDLSLVYAKDGNGVLSGFSDAAWANDDGRKSTSGFVTKIGNSMVTWKTSKQKVVALSSTEAELISLTETAKEIIWIKRLLDHVELYGRDMVDKSKPVVIHEDNTSTIELSKHHGFHSRTKHIDIRYHFIRDKVLDGSLGVKYCPTGDMVADMFTKALAAPAFTKLRKLCGFSY